MTDDELLQSLLDKLDEFDKKARGAALFATEYATNYLDVEDERRAHRLVSLLENEGLINHIRYSEWNLTDKGRYVIDNGGWAAYKQKMEAHIRRAAQDAKLIEVKAKGEALQFKFWWIPIVVSVITMGWTVIHDLRNDSPSREEFNILKSQLKSLRNSKPIPMPKPAPPTKPTSLSVK